MQYDHLKTDTDIEYRMIQLGVVEDNNDPECMGRCRVRILGFHSPEKTFNGEEGMAITDLPWATPANPIQGGSISGLGWSGVPVLGSHVAIFFIGGDHNYPVYFATISGKYLTQPDTKKGFCDPNGVYPKELNTPDFNSLASPTNTIFETPDGGVRMEYDSTPGSEKWKVTLKSTGEYIELTSNGECNIVSVDTKIDGDLEVTGNVKVGGGASGAFATISGHSVTVVNGIVTSIVPTT